MGRARQTKRFATMKRMMSASDPRLKDKDRAPPKKKKAEDPNEIKTTEHVQQSSALFFQYNTQLGPPFHVLVDTNFINFSIKNKMDIIQSMMDCLYAKCIPYIRLDHLKDTYKGTAMMFLIRFCVAVEIPD